MALAALKSFAEYVKVVLGCLNPAESIERLHSVPKDPSNKGQSGHLGVINKSK